MKELVLSYSRISTWKQNHFDHYMRYVKRIVPQGESAPLKRGHMMHELLEAYGNNESWIKAWEKQKAEYDDDPMNLLSMGDLPYMIRELMENWVYYWGEIEEERTVISSEQEFTLPLCKGYDENGKKVQIYLNGFIDSVFEEDGDVYIRDYKTFAKTKPYEFFLYNYQSSIYQWALPQLLGGVKAKGMEWDVITAKTPTKPKLLKNQELSVAKLASTPYTVSKGIKELGLNPKDYRDFINKHTFDDFFRRYMIRRSKRAINFMMDDIKQSAKQICRYQNEFKDYNLDTQYPSSYRDLWQTQMMGGDVDFVLDTKYKAREDKPRDKKEGKGKQSKKAIIKLKR